MDIIDVAELAILLTARIDDLSKKMDLAKTRITSLQKHTASTSNLMRNSWMRVAGGLAAMGISVYGAIAAIRSAVTTNVEFNKSMTDVLSKTQATSSEMTRMEEIARRMGATTVFTAAQAADAMAGLATMGLKTADDMNNVLEPALNLAAATNISIGQSSEQVVKAIKAFRLEMSDAARVANVLAAAHVNSTATVDVLREAFKYAGPVAGDLGQSIEDVSAIAANFTNIGLEASQAGTAYRMVMARLTKAFKENGEASGEAGKILASHGFTQEKMAALLPKPIELMQELKKAQLGNAESIQVYGVRAKFAFSGLVDLSDQIGILRDKITGTNAAQEIAAIQLTSIWGKARILNSVYQELTLTIGDKLVPFVKTLLDVLAESITSLTKNKQNMDVLIGIIRVLATVFIRAGQIIANVASILKFLGTGFSILHRVITNLLPTFGKYGESLTSDILNPTLAFAKLIMNNVLPALEKLHKTMSKDDWDTTTVEDLKDAYKTMSQELITNSINAERLVDSLSKVGQTGSFFDNVIKAQERVKELSQQVEDANAQTSQTYSDKEAELLTKILELENYKVDAKRNALNRELKDLEAAGVRKELLTRYEANKILEIRASLAKDQLSSLQKMDTYERASAADKVSMLQALLANHKGNALARLEIEEELAGVIKDKNKEAMQQLNDYIQGPLTEGFTSFFKSVWEGTANSQKFFESFGKAMAKSILNALAKIAEGYAAAAIGQAASKGLVGMVIEQPAIIAAASAAAILHGLAASFAKGGIVGSEGLAVVGDTPNLQPEVIAPLDKLQEMLLTPRVTDGISTSTAFEELSDKSEKPNVTVVIRPTFSTASPAEARRFGEEIVRLLQSQGWRK